VLLAVVTKTIKNNYIIVAASLKLNIGPA